MLVHCSGGWVLSLGTVRKRTRAWCHVIRRIAARDVMQNRPQGLHSHVKRGFDGEEPEGVLAAEGLGPFQI